MTLRRYFALGQGTPSIIDTSGSSSTQGWTVIATVPAAQLTGGSTYTVIATGVLGNFLRFDVPPAPGDIHAQLEFREGTGTYFGAGLGHQQDPFYPPYRWDKGANNVDQDGFRGLPFMMIQRHTVPATPQDLHLVARIYKRTPNLSPNAVYMVDEPSVLALHEDDFGAETQYVASTSTTTTLTTTTQVLTSISHATGGLWLIGQASHATVSTLADQYRTLTFVDDQGGNFPMDFLGRSSYGTNAVAFGNQLWEGQWHLATLPSSWTLRQLGRVLEPQISAVHQRGILFAALLHADQDGHAFTDQDVQDFWARKYEGSPHTGTVSLAGANTMYALVSVPLPDSDQFDLAYHPYVELNGGEIGSEALFAKGAAGSARARSACYNRIVPIGHVPAGDHTLALLTSMNRFDRQQPAAPTPREARHIHLGALGFQSDFQAIAPTLETPGPVVVLTPDREAPVNLASLQALPSEFSMPLTVEEVGERRELRAHRGDLITSPKFIEARLLCACRWTGLGQTDGEALVSFFDDVLLNDGGVFKHTLPGEPAESAIAVNRDSYDAERRADGVYSITWDGIVLQWIPV